MSTTITMPQRLSYIDNLRVVAFTFMVVFHAFKLFSPEGWHIQHTPMDWAKLSAEIISSWRLPLLFFISGSALSLSIRKQNIATRSAKKLLPLLIVGPPILVSAANYLADLHLNAQASYWFHLNQYFSNMLKGNLSWYHLWYLGYILFFAVIHQWIYDRIRFRGANWHVNPWLILSLLILLTLFNEWLLRPHFPVRRDFFHDLASIVTFACFYGAGILVIHFPVVLEGIQRGKFALLFASFVFIFIHFNPIGLPFFLTKMAVAWSVTLGMNGFFQRFLNIKNSFTTQLHGRMLDIYAVHQVTLLFAAVITASMTDTPLKVAVIFGIGFGLAYASGWLKRKIFIIGKGIVSIVAIR